MKTIKELGQELDNKYEEYAKETISAIIGDCEYWEGEIDTEKMREKLRENVKDFYRQQMREIMESLIGEDDIKGRSMGRTYVTKNELRAEQRKQLQQFFED